jgi:hypothetical protein
MAALPDKLDAIGTEMEEAATAQNHFIEVANRAAELHNEGNEAGATALFQTDAAGALADVERESAEAQRAVEAARSALQALEEVL